MGNSIDLAGSVFGRLTVVRRLPNKNNRICWECRCICGKIVQPSTKDLRGKRTQSCGCLRKGPRCRKSLAAKEVSAEEKENRRIRRNAYNRRWYAENREKVYGQRIAWVKRNPEKRKLVSRNFHLKYEFGISVDIWEQMFSTQGKMCAICKCTKPRGGRWAVDHCHKTGKIRAILCMICNTGVGKFNDDPVLLRTAADYLEGHARG